MPIPDRLMGWKAIASYLGISPRTALRWTVEDGMPVHRRGGKFVYAFTRDLEAWLEREGVGSPAMS